MIYYFHLMNYIMINMLHSKLKIYRKFTVIFSRVFIFARKYTKISYEKILFLT